MAVRILRMSQIDEVEIYDHLIHQGKIISSRTKFAGNFYRSKNLGHRVTWESYKISEIIWKRVRATGRDEKIEKFLFDNQLNSGLSESGQTTVEENSRNSRNAASGMLPTEINQTGQVWFFTIQKDLSRVKSSHVIKMTHLTSGSYMNNCIPCKYCK